MPGYEDTHWAETERSVADFIKKFGKIPAEDRSAEAMVEIAIQLMWVNAHLQGATYRRSPVLAQK
jgi:hypothetical protein